MLSSPELVGRHFEGVKNAFLLRSAGKLQLPQKGLRADSGNGERCTNLRTCG